MNQQNLLLDQLNLITRPSQRLFSNFNEFINKNNIEPGLVCNTIDTYINKYRKHIDSVMTFVLLLDFLLTTEHQQLYQKHWNKATLSKLLHVLEHYHKQHQTITLLKRNWGKSTQDNHNNNNDVVLDFTKMVRDDFVVWLHDYEPPACFICKTHLKLHYDHDNEAWICTNASLFDNKILCHKDCV